MPLHGHESVVQESREASPTFGRLSMSPDADDTKRKGEVYL